MAKKLQIIIPIVISWHKTACYKNICVIYTFQKQPSRIFLMKNWHEQYSEQKFCRKLTGEHRCWNVISIKSDFNMGFFPVNFLNFSEHLFIRTLLEGCSQIKHFTIPYFTNSQIFLSGSILCKETLNICHRNLMFSYLYFFLIYFSPNHISNIYLFWGTDLLEIVSLSV